jgi:hypothetical protein
MTDYSAATDPFVAATRLSEAVAAANTLLYHVISCGQDLPDTVRDPIIKARVALEHGQTLTDQQEAMFLDAYGKLALRAMPVTAATLEATRRRRARRGWFGRFLGLKPVSDAQRLALWFGFIALFLIGVIAVTEWTSAFIGSILAAEKQFAANDREIRDVVTKIRGLKNQIHMLTAGNEAVPDTPSAAAVREALRTRQEDLESKLDSLGSANEQIFAAKDEGYKTLERIRVLSRDEIALVIQPLATILTSFSLPVLYGALGSSPSSCGRCSARWSIARSMSVGRGSSWSESSSGC